MVVYELVQQEGSLLLYSYWPENNRGSDPGFFLVDLVNQESCLIQPARDDFQSRTTGAAMNKMRDDINTMRLERNEPALTEDELPSEPSDAVYKWWWYYDKAVASLSRKIDTKQDITRDMSAWY